MRESVEYALERPVFNKFVRFLFPGIGPVTASDKLVIITHGRGSFDQDSGMGKQPENQKKTGNNARLGMWAHLGSNQGPSDYESDALTG